MDGRPQHHSKAFRLPVCFRMRCISSKYGYFKLVPLFFRRLLFMIHGDTLLFAEQNTLPIQYWVFEAKNKARKCLRGMGTNTDA